MLSIIPYNLQQVMMSPLIAVDEQVTLLVLVTCVTVSILHRLKSPATKLVINYCIILNFFVYF